MKIKNLLIGIGLVACGMFASCSMEMDDLNVKTNSLLVKAPEIIPTGNWFEGSLTRSISNDPHKNYKVQDYNLNENFKEQNPDLYEIMSNAPSQVTDDEWNFVKEYLANHPNEGGTVCDLTEYFIQWCGKSNEHYYGMKDQNGADHDVIGSQHMDYIEIDGVHLPDYNGNYGPIEYLENWPLNNPTYHDSYGDVSQIKENMYRFYYIEYNGEWGLYLCFDYTTQKNSGEYLPGDGVFNDWVLKITPANGIVTPPNENNGDIEIPENPDPNFGITPNEPSVDNKDNHRSEVEVNLSADEHKDYQASHLSIHIRYAGDVEVFIPIPKEYYCDVDDMAIVMKHEPNHMETINREFTLKDSDLTVSIEVIYEDGGIRIKTHGVTQEVIDWCYEKCEDGITFEVWNYFNENITKEKLREFLNESTIEFLGDELPDYYINAFNDTDAGDIFEWDCTVDIIKDQQNSFNEPTTGEHLNGSPYNEIYDKK